jgi:glycosyltransferase involved in cell wall biosynthesis
MHVLMVGTDTTLMTKQIGNSRARHEGFAEQVGRISVVVCNCRMANLEPYHSERLHVRPTQSRSYAHYLIDGYRLALKFHHEQPVDLITAQDPFLTALIGLMLRRRLKVPLIVQDHSSFVENRYFAAEHSRNRVLQWIARRTLPRADALRVENQQERLACIRLGVPPDHVCSIPLAPDIERFLQPVNDEQKRECYARLGIQPGTPIVLWVGRPVPVKNLPMLLEAFTLVHAECPNAHLIIAGDVTGTDFPVKAQSLGLAPVVHFPGPIAHASLPALYQIATVYAHSSNYEGFGLVLVEAGASGLPVVSTATDGAREIVIDGETGTLVPVGDGNAMANALLALLRDSAIATAMGNHARRTVPQRFDPKAISARWIAMWPALIAGKSPCAP